MSENADWQAGLASFFTVRNSLPRDFRFDYFAARSRAGKTMTGSRMPPTCNGPWRIPPTPPSAMNSGSTPFPPAGGNGNLTTPAPVSPGPVT